MKFKVERSIPEEIILMVLVKMKETSEAYLGITVWDDTHLGDKDFDNSIVTYFSEESESKFKKDLHSNPRVLRKLRTVVERAVRSL